MEDKKSLRRRYKAIRGAVFERKEKSRCICENAAALPEFKRARNVLLYSAVGSEVDLSYLFQKARDAGKAVFYPRCMGEGEMVFLKVDDPSQLIEGNFGIKEPSENAGIFAGGDSTVCFVPAIAYSEKGYRLGYGGGYYDRFLSDFKGTAVGIAFEECIAKALPTEDHDIKTDYIITESRVTKTFED